MKRNETKFENEVGVVGVQKAMWFGASVSTDQRLTGLWSPGPDVAQAAAALLLQGISDEQTVNQRLYNDGYCYVLLMVSEHVHDAVRVAGRFPTWQQLMELPFSWYKPISVLNAYSVTRHGQAGLSHIVKGDGLWSLLLTMAVVASRSKEGFSMGTFGMSFERFSASILGAVRHAPDVLPIDCVGYAGGPRMQTEFLTGGGFRFVRERSRDVDMAESGVYSAPTTYRYVSPALANVVGNQGWEPYEPYLWYGSSEKTVEKKRDVAYSQPNRCYGLMAKPAYLSFVTAVGDCPLIADVLKMPFNWFESLDELATLRVEADWMNRVHHVGRQGYGLLGVLAMIARKLSDPDLAEDSLGHEVLVLARNENRLNYHCTDFESFNVFDRIGVGSGVITDTGTVVGETGFGSWRDIAWREAMQLCGNVGVDGGVVHVSALLCLRNSVGVFRNVGRQNITECSVFEATSSGSLEVGRDCVLFGGRFVVGGWQVDAIQVPVGVMNASQVTSDGKGIVMRLGIGLRLRPPRTNSSRMSIHNLVDFVEVYWPATEHMIPVYKLSFSSVGEGMCEAKIKMLTDTKFQIMDTGQLSCALIDAPEGTTVKMGCFVRQGSFSACFHRGLFNFGSLGIVVKPRMDAEMVLKCVEDVEEFDAYHSWDEEDQLVEP